MKIAFTICSNNYLPRAKTLLDSIIYFSPEYILIIILCDNHNDQIDYSLFRQFNLIPINDLNIKDFDKICSKYKLIELNTAIKPYAFDYIYKNFNAETVTYIDPDICMFAPFSAIEAEHIGYSMLLTPHILTPLDFDGLTPTENTFTQYGTFNLGFLATRRDKNTFKMLEWWKSRLAINCYKKPQEGIFVDQLPMNLAPIFFDGIKISKNFGFNMAPWNLHERKLTVRDNTFFVNENTPLVFYHFSKFRPGIKTFAQPYSREPQGDLRALTLLHQIYEDRLLQNQFAAFEHIECAYAKPAQPTPPQPQPLLKKLLQRVAG